MTYDQSNLDLPELWEELFAAAVDEQLNEHQHQKLSDLLRQDDSARQAYLAFAGLHASLLWRYRENLEPAPQLLFSPVAPSSGRGAEGDLMKSGSFTSSTTRIRAESVSDRWIPTHALTLGALISSGQAEGEECVDSQKKFFVSTDEPTNTPRKPAVNSQSVPWMVAIFTVAASLLFVAVWSGFGIPKSFQSVAILTQSEDGILRDARNNVLRVGEAIDFGPHTLNDGVIEVSLTNAVRLTIEGPSQFDVVSPMKLSLREGRLAASVPAHAIGFTISTPNGDIVDQGTEFGVDVHEDASNVEVFEGNVRLVSHVDAGKERGLAEGMQAQLSRDGSIGEVDDSNGAKFWIRSLIQSPFVRELGGPTRVHVVEPNQPDLLHDLNRTNEFYLIAERQNVLLTESLNVSRSPMKGRFGESIVSSTIPAGTHVDSFLVHFDNTALPSDVSRLVRHSTIRFHHRVLGVLYLPTQLDATDALLGSPELNYPTGLRPEFDSSANTFFRLQESANHRLQGSFYFSSGRRPKLSIQWRVIVDPNSHSTNGGS